MRACGHGVCVCACVWSRDLGIQESCFSKCSPLCVILLLQHQFVAPLLCVRVMGTGEGASVRSTAPVCARHECVFDCFRVCSLAPSSVGLVCMYVFVCARVRACVRACARAHTSIHTHESVCARAHTPTPTPPHLYRELLDFFFFFLHQLEHRTGLLVGSPCSGSHG